MGCSSSKSTATLDDIRSRNSNSSSSTSAVTKRSQPPPPPPPSSRLTKGSKMEYPASEAFTIPLNDDSTQLGETLRQPPKRIQELMDQAAASEATTLDELEDKQQRAEQRRQELMQIKLENIQKTTNMLMHEPMQEEEEEEGSQLTSSSPPQAPQQPPPANDN